VRPLPALYILLGGSVGFILTVVAVLVINELDDSLKSVDQIEKLLNLPVLGSVLENKGANNGLVTLHDPLSIEAENFRALGASLEIIGTERRFRAVMIINSEPTNARTVIAANLAIVNVQQGKHVILIDSDLMHPYLHGLFGLENQMGVAEIIKDGVDVKSVLHVVKDLEGLTLIPSGLAEKESPVRLDVKKWEQLLLKLYKLADLVIVDGPPADMADTQILASKMDAVLLTIQAGHTRAAIAQETLKKLQLIGVKVAGTILNRITRNRKIKKPLLNRFKIKPKEKKDQGKVEGEIDTQAISLF
jgi:capsular exopolysaccharide synthesis family protein